MADAASFPYYAVPREARWGKMVVGHAPQDIDPHYNSRLHIERTDKIASAGSCFAQRISEALQSSGYTYFVTEEGPPFLSAERKHELGYRIYSARYGNIYTARQLLQLFDRAYGEFATPTTPATINFGRIAVDLERLLVYRAGGLVDLTPTEFRLLRHLISHPQRPFGREQLIEVVWGYESDIGSDRTVDVHMRHLRQKLEDDPANPRWLVTVRGAGYKFQP